MESYVFKVSQEEVEKQLQLWKCHNNAESIEDVRLIMFIN